MSAKDFKWYVYELYDPDTETVFYVGKGKGERIDAHEYQASKGVVSHKCNKIREVIGRCGAIGKRKVAYFNDEQAAYIHEANRIAEYGMKNLTNAVLATTLVSNKKLVVESGTVALEIIKAFSDKFANWMKITKAGLGVIEITGVNEQCKQLTETFYNDFFPKVLQKAISSEGCRNKLAVLMRKYNIEISYVAS